MQSEKEKELVRSVLSGNRLAFKTLVQEYEKLVLHIITPLTGILQDREDICQEVFIKVYRGLGSFKHDSRLSTWIGNIAYNTGLNFLRKKGKEVLTEYRGTEEGSRDEPLTSVMLPTPEQQYIKKERSLSVTEAVEMLPEMQRIVVILFHYDELSLREISGVLNMPENSVKSHLFRGRKKLKELINM